MKLIHHSTESFYRKPLGAVPAGMKVSLRAAVENGGVTPDRVEVRAWDGTEHRYPMRFIGDREGLGYYEVQVSVSDRPCLYWYRFEAFAGNERYVLGAGDDGTGCGNGQMESEESFQITVYDPEYKTPDWMHEGIMYQIMVDRFYHGEGTDNLLHKRDGEKVRIHKQWDEMPYLTISENGDNLANDFFGGNLEGVRQKLGYLHDLGVTVLYFNPIFKAASNHKYDTADYKTVDPMFGDEKTLSLLCEEARKMGIRVMLDGVFSHVGDDSVYFNRRGTHGEKVGAYRDQNSPYYKWFTFKHWPESYECWWGFKTLPNVNEMDEDYRRYILSDKDSVVRHWVHAGTSGWRLDVADELPMDFLRELRREVKSESEDAAVLGEVWEDASHKVSYGKMRSYVLGDTLDSVMNYPLRDALIDFLRDKIPAGKAAKDLTALQNNYPKPFLYSLMNLMGSHDRPRILNVLACNDGNDLPRDQRAGLKLSLAETMIGLLREGMMFRFIVSVPGMPCIYYGDEAGLEGSADPYCRRTYPWGHADERLLETYKHIISVRKTHAELRTGECRYIAPSPDVLGVVRTITDGTDVFGNKAPNACTVTLINRSSRPQDVFLMRDDVCGARQMISEETGETIVARANAFTVHMHGMRSVMLFAVMDN